MKFDNFFFRAFYVIGFLIFTFYLYIKCPWGGNETVGYLRDIHICNEKDEFSDKSMEVFYFEIETQDGNVSNLRCHNYRGWCLDSLMQYKNQKLILTWEEGKYLPPNMGLNTNSRTPRYVNSIMIRIQDSFGNDIPQYMPYYKKTILFEYIYITLIVYILGLILCIYFLKSWIRNNIFTILFILVLWMVVYYSYTKIYTKVHNPVSQQELFD